MKYATEQLKIETDQMFLEYQAQVLQDGRIFNTERNVLRFYFANVKNNEKRKSVIICI